MREMVVDLRRSARHKQEQAARVTSAPRRSLRAWPIAAAVAVAASLAIAWFLGTRSNQPVTAQDVRVQRLTDTVGLEETPALSPDGRAVAFVAASGGRRQIWVRLLAGGAPLALTKEDADHYEPRWAPDSASLIYFTPAAQPEAQGAIWEIPALGGVARRVVAALGPGDLSHDGRSLAFFRSLDGAAELALASRNLSVVRTAAKLDRTSVVGYPRWSPDDRHIAFKISRLRLAADSLTIVDAAGGETRVIPQPAQIQGLAWMPDGAGLIVSSGQGSSMLYPRSFNLWAIPLRGGAATQLTFGEASYESADVDARGNLVTSRVRSQSDVWKIPLTGTPESNSQRAVRITSQTGQVQTVTVSPDESEVAFLSDNGGHANVWVARVADGEMRPVTREFNPDVLVTVPVWSPRGDWINFLSNRNSGSSGITLWLATPDGSEARDLGVPGSGVCWSGDGRWIYFSVDDKMRKIPASGGQAVAVRDDNAIGCAITPDGSALYYVSPTTLSSGAPEFEIRVARPENAPSQFIGRISGARVPVRPEYVQLFLSPDGKWLATPLIDGSTTNLWALPTTGGDWRKLTEFSPRNVRIVRRIGWSRDSQSIYASVADVDSDIVMLAGLRW
jgi:Tol biopolymer transport system component